MTSSNPLRSAHTHPPAPIDWPARVRQRNAEMPRDDIEWAVSPNGLSMYLRYRRDQEIPWREWRPEPGEIEATHVVVARAINAGLPSEEWRRLVLSGAITREVTNTMREQALALTADCETEEPRNG